MQRSTEQLTRCSTISLEERTTEKTTGNAESSQTIPKIMSVCRNTIRWVLLIDVLLAVTVIVLMGIMEFGNFPRHQIGFFCKDPKLSFKFTGDTISVSVLLIVSILMPIIVMLIIEYSCYAADSYEESGSRGSRLKQVWFWYGHYAIGIVALTVGCNVMKIVIGEPRPHFFDTCRPREAKNCTTEYISSYTCTNKIDSNWFVSDSSKSFPSSHSALSMFTTIFVVYYLQQRMPNKTFLLKPWILFTVCMWTVVCSLTRIGDNRHHWWDVLAGLVLGLIAAVLVVLISCREFRLDNGRQMSKNVSRLRREFVQTSEPIAFDDKSYQNVNKKLVNSANNVDIPEGRELRDITVSWKE